MISELTLISRTFEMEPELREAMVHGDISGLKELLQKRKEIESTLGDDFLENKENLFHLLVHSRVPINKNKQIPAIPEGNENQAIAIVSEVQTHVEIELPSEYSKLDDDFIQSLQNFETDVHLPWKWLELGNLSKKDDWVWKTIVYILSEEENINDIDDLGRTPLFIACCNGDALLCDVMLQCGADPNFIVGNQSIMSHAANFAIKEELIIHEKKLGKKKLSTTEERIFGPARVTFEICKFYWPGLWSAVEIESIENVRRLLNSWCRIDLKRGDKTLQELALSGGNETITSLLTNIGPTIDMIYKVLTKNREYLLKLLENPERGKINFNLKKLSERGASLLYFLIQSEDEVLVKDLIDRGASPFTMMSDHEDIEFPVIFTAIHSEVQPEMIRTLLSSTCRDRTLDLYWYKGKTLLQDAVEKQVSGEAIVSILEEGGPYLLADRGPLGNSVIEELLLQGRDDLVKTIDDMVTQWVTKPKLYPGWREILILRGFSNLEKLKKNTCAKVSLDENQKLFFKEAFFCQNFIETLFEDAKYGVAEDFVHMNEGMQTKFFNVIDLLWHGRLKGYGMTLLHWVVLHKRAKILEIILQLLFDDHVEKSRAFTKSMNLDEVRDQWRRTPMHYGYGLIDSGQIMRLLSSTGASEHALDMFYKEPLDFRDASGSQEMENLLENIRYKNSEIDQEEPWRPEALRRHQQKKRRQQFENEAKNPSHHHLFGLHHYYKFNQDFLRHFHKDLPSTFCRSSFDGLSYPLHKQKSIPFGLYNQTFDPYSLLQSSLVNRPLETNNNSHRNSNNNVYNKLHEHYFNHADEFSSARHFYRNSSDSNYSDEGVRKFRNRKFCLIM